jgi:hypothetical protein
MADLDLVVTAAMAATAQCWGAMAAMAQQLPMSMLRTPKA